MSGPLIDQILTLLKQAESAYYRLVLVVAPSGGGKTEALKEVANRLGLPVLNLNLELSARLLELTRRQRPLQLLELVGEIVASVASATALLDNTEILFDPSLKQDPLRMLQMVSSATVPKFTVVVRKGFGAHQIQDGWGDI